MVRRLAIAFVLIVVVAWAAVPAARTATLLACGRSAPVDPAPIAPVESITFFATDGVSLSGWYAVDPAARATVVLVHGFKTSRSEMLDWASFLRAAHYSVLLYDGRGCGQSTGVFGAGATEPRDIAGAATYVRAHGAPGSGHVAVLGLSLGAGDAILAAASDAQIDAVIADSAWTDQRVRLDGMRTLKAGPVAVPVLPYEPALVDLIVVGRLEDARPIDVVGRIAPRPLLLIHGLADTNDTTTVAGARELADRAGEPKQLWLVPGAEHAGALRTDPDGYRQQVVAFLAAAFRGP